MSIVYMKKSMFIIFVFLYFNNCSLFQSIIQNEIISRPYRSSDNTILNYEDATKKYTIDNIDAHYQLHIEIEKPFIIKSFNYNIDEIYKISDIDGSTIFHAKLDTKGKILSYKIIKRAGLGLDEIAEKIFMSMKLSPGYIAGYSYKTQIYVTISFSGKEKYENY